MYGWMRQTDEYKDPSVWWSNKWIDRWMVKKLDGWMNRRWTEILKNGWTDGNENILPSFISFSTLNQSWKLLKSIPLVFQTLGTTNWSLLNSLFLCGWKEANHLHRLLQPLKLMTQIFLIFDLKILLQRGNAVGWEEQIKVRSQNLKWPTWRKKGSGNRGLWKGRRNKGGPINMQSTCVEWAQSVHNSLFRRLAAFTSGRSFKIHFRD